MKLATFRRRADPRASGRLGVVRDGFIVDVLGAADTVGHLPAELSRDHLISLKGLLAAGPRVLATVGQLAERAIESQARRPAGGALVAMSETELLPPIPDTGKFLCVGKNSRAHLEELRRTGLIKENPQEPTGFVKLNSCLVGHDARVARPEEILAFDYEPEMVFVIGRPAYRVARANALDYVAGVTLLNDLTAREIQKREVASGTRFWTAKNMPGFGPVGPWLITLDEVGDPQKLWITCAVNGEQRIRVNTSDHIFKIGDIVEHFSRYLPLEPGDMFSTGSPGGVAVGQANAEQLYLKPGDVIEVGIEGHAILRTFIVAPS